MRLGLRKDEERGRWFESNCPACGTFIVSNAGQSLSRRGLCLILSSPSGAGKTTLARLLLASDDALRSSISVTTREPRPREKEGVDYSFVSRKQFEDLKTSGNLLEWAEVFGNLYGTPAEPVKTALAEGRDILFDVDWQGAASIAALLTKRCRAGLYSPPFRRRTCAAHPCPRIGIAPPDRDPAQGRRSGNRPLD
jgi:hypothetical protein